MDIPAAWSFSAYKDFVNCPKKYYHTRVAQDVVSEPHPTAIAGNRIHKALENAVRDGTPLPEALRGGLDKYVTQVINMRGEKLVEHQLAVTADLDPCGFHDEVRWWRGIADVLVIDGRRAFVLDWKTGASTRFADTDQLEILAAGVMVHWPRIERVDGALIFTTLDVPIPMSRLHRAQLPEVWRKWQRNLHPLQVAFETGVWNTRKSGLCRFCPVRDCIHHPG